MYYYPCYYSQSQQINQPKQPTQYLNNAVNQYLDSSANEYLRDSSHYDNKLNQYNWELNQNEHMNYFGMAHNEIPTYTHTSYAIAHIKGGPLAPKLNGIVTFKSVPGGTEVCVEMFGLPDYKPAQNGRPPVGPHGFHIHEFGNCEIGDPKNPFQKAGGHWNPEKQKHGNHAGDFPVLFSNDGYARMCFFTNKFNVQDAIGKSVIIHENPDDYRTQPAGSSGKRLACGIIK